MNGLTIGRVSKATDVKVPTIRFYEQIGLMPEPTRTLSDRRVYDVSAVRRLSFVKHARQLGFSIDAIRVLLNLADNPERPCDDANDLAAEQLAEVEVRIRRLEGLRDELQRMVDASCRGPAGSYRVLETLADHDLCAREHTSG